MILWEYLEANMVVIIVLALVVILFTISTAILLEERKNVVIDVDKMTDDASVIFEQEKNDDLI